MTEEWRRDTSITIYSSPAGQRDYSHNSLTIKLDAWAKRRYIVSVYKRMLRSMIASKLVEYPDLDWMTLFGIWRGVARDDVFNLLFAAHMASVDNENLRFDSHYPEKVAS